MGRKANETEERLKAIRKENANLRAREKTLKEKLDRLPIDWDTDNQALMDANADLWDENKKLKEELAGKKARGKKS